MTKTKLKVPVYEFRPLREDFYGEIFRWNNGKPVKDDDQYDLAFFSLAGPPIVVSVEVPYRNNIIWAWDGGNWGRYEPRHKFVEGNAWHYMTRDGTPDWDKSNVIWDRDSHPNEVAQSKAMNYVTSERGCANGHPIDFHIDNKYIRLGLMRRADTKEVVKIPEKFICIECGDITDEVQTWLKEHPIKPRK